MKSDTSIRNICIASIKRKIIDPSNFSLTRMFETEAFPEIHNGTFKLSDVYENELPISQTIVDRNNWTLVTTRQIITCIDGLTQVTKANSVLSWDWNDFKGYDNKSFTIGQLQLGDQKKIEIFIETGKTSLVTIYAIMVLVRQVSTLI
jgi:hypothetical protein